MLEVFLTLFVLMGGGVVVRFIPGFPERKQVRQTIGTAVLMFFLPALSFRVLYEAPLTTELLAVPVVSAIVTLVSLGAAFVVYGLFFRGRLPRPVIGALILASTWCNATYLGLPVVKAVVGDHMQRIPIEFDLLAMTPLLFTIGTVISVEYGTRGTRHTFVEGLRQVVLLPPFLAAFAGIACNALHIPIAQWLLNALHTAGGVVAPLMLFNVGLALAMPRLNTLARITPALIIKLILAPLIGFVAIQWFITDVDVARATLLESAMPTMVLTMVFAERYGLDEETLAQAIIISTLLSMLTLPYIATF